MTNSRKRRQFTKTNGFDEEIHSAKTFGCKNSFQAIAVRNAACVDDATMNRENGKNTSHRSLMMSSDVNREHFAPKKIHTLQRAAKKEKSIRVCSEGKRSWQCLSKAVCDKVIGPKDLTADEEQVMETLASANQENSLAANGEEIDKYGEVKVQAVTPRENIEMHHIPGRWSVERFAQC